MRTCVSLFVLSLVVHSSAITVASAGEVYYLPLKEKQQSGFTGTDRDDVHRGLVGWAEEDGTEFRATGAASPEPAVDAGYLWLAWETTLGQHLPTSLYRFGEPEGDSRKS